METKHDKHGGNAFLWGLIIGALLATLLTTKRGRQILRELTNLGLELFEDFVEERTKKNDESHSTSSGQARIMNEEENMEDAEEIKEDIESEITEVETKPEEKEPIEEFKEVKTNGNDHKKRLFKGIRRK